EVGRATYAWVTDEEAIRGMQLLAAYEGIISALECAHAVAYATTLAPEMGRNGILLINLSGRGDKDVELVAQIIESRS
ncbi:MAG: tryptophan synthase subunit beta, partial [Candidatus Methylomirabilales bacterium]